MIPQTADPSPDCGSDDGHIRPAVNNTTVYQRQLYIRILRPHCYGESDAALCEVGRIISEYILSDYRHSRNPAAIGKAERELRDCLGRDHAKRFGHILLRNKKWRFGENAPYTRELTVRQDIADAIDTAFRDQPRPVSPLLRLVGNAKLDRRTKARHGVKLTTRRGSGLIGIPGLAQVDVREIQRTETVLSCWLDAAETGVAPDLAPIMYRELFEKHCARHEERPNEFPMIWIQTLRARLDDAQNMLELVRADGSGGKLPQWYEQRKGMPRYIGTGTNLQNCPRELRYAALTGQWSYDIECCHHTALLTFEDAAKPCDMVREYVNDRASLRKEFAAIAQVSEEDMKTVLLAVVYGGRFRWSLESIGSREWAIRDILGVDGQKRLMADKRFKRFYRQIRRLMIAAIAQSTPGRGSRGKGFRNAVGQYMQPPVKGAVKGRSKGKRKNERARFLAFILQGIETQAKLAMLTVAPSAQVDIHDGIVTAEQCNVVELERAMLEATGIPFKVEEKRTRAPEWA